MSSKVSVIGLGDFAPIFPLTKKNSAVNDVWDYLNQKDIVLANLELPLTTSEVKADKAITLKAHPDISNSLSLSGIDVFTLANNHALDFGSQGILETKKLLQEEGFISVGAGEDLASAIRPHYLTLKETKIAILGFSSALPTGYAAGVGRPGIAPIRAIARFRIDSMTLDEQPGMAPWVETSVVIKDQEMACEVITQAKRQADVVIVNMHWGVPNGWCAAFQGPLADYQRPLAHALIDAGADFILGHHPHVIHGVEKYNEGIIAYSLGNFLFHSMGNKGEHRLKVGDPPYDVMSLETGEAREAVVMEINLEEKKKQRIHFYPVTLNSEGEPEFLTGRRAKEVLHRLKRHSEKLQTQLCIENDAVASLKLASPIHF
ncbi:capsular polysaccharide biosynthesis protein [Pullulanibacillus camelliae]|uniref:Capsular polysaccharide biosynthesis protein n=1 Tax=Pullulanibacillus camelliae TaxID=1707096 RepID=A0A8J3DVL0_9BACL|nr:CapA family protein [Pullulanibacillus camelliae]GGE45079.1 capsular polysaccharide biosynthesis protein [Pullulanibacillus camelliae]